MNSDYIINSLNKLIPDPKCSLNYTKDYELLIATMLSAQSTDARVNEVTKVLFKYNLKELQELDIGTIEKIIKPVGTYHKKAIFIKKIASILVNNYDGIVPYDRKLVESLPGVGHKTCNVVFSEIYNEDTIAVDTHVTRISKRLGLAEENDNVEVIENKLKQTFNQKDWSRLHLQLVLFGRNKCKAIKPDCMDCPFIKECKNHSK